MSAKSQFLLVFGAPSLKLFHQLYFSLLLFFLHCIQQLCCSSEQSFNLRFSPVSMRLRPKRTCSGVECFGGFHIKRFIALFIFLRETLT